MPEIRQLSTADLPAVVMLEAAIFPDPWTSAVLVQRCRHPRGIGLGVWCEGVLAGYLVASWVLDEAELLRIGVSPLQRQQGLGKALFWELERQLQSLSVTRLMLEVRSGNKAAGAFYAQLGFEQDGRRRAYYPAPQGGREDALLLSYRIS